MKTIVTAFLAGLLVMAGVGGWWLHQNDDLPTAQDEPAPEIDRSLPRTDETIAVGEVLNGIRRLNRLVIFQAYVTATTTTHEIGWITQANQTMLTPAYVNYYIDMDTIGPQQIRISGKDVFLSRPAIMIERPNVDTLHVQVFNDGLWTNLTSTTERLRLRNNRMALRQLIWRAKMGFLVQAARNAAVAAEEMNVRRALALSGHTDLNIHVVP